MTNSFDLAGRLASRKYPDGGVENFGYSASGLVAYTNQIGKVTRFAYNRKKCFPTRGGVSNKVPLPPLKPASQF